MRKLVTTIVAGLVLALLQFAGPVQSATAVPDMSGATQTQSSARMECPSDMPNCVRAQRRAENFKRGKYGKYRARAAIHYPRGLKRTLTNKVIKRSRSITRHERGKAWRAIAGGDTCVVPQSEVYDPSISCTKAGKIRRRDWTNAEIEVFRIAGYGWAGVLMYYGGPAIAIGTGVSISYWDRFLSYVKRHQRRN